MKSIFKSFLLSAAAIVGLSACSSDDYDLPAANLSPEDLVEGIAFSITPDTSNPNIIHLKSLLPASYQVAWETPQGRSVGAEKDLKIPFNGEYEVKIGVSTRGGYVWSNPAKFIVADFCAEFVDNFLWNRISGGVGNSKTWQLDLATLEDGTVKTTRFKGPHWFFNVNYTWDKLHAASETENSYANFLDSSPWESSAAIDPTPAEKDVNDSEAGWYWAADYAGNSWMIGDDLKKPNYGYMTFDLINGANVTITDADGTVLSKGTYMIDVDNHTIAFGDCTPLNTNGRTDRSFKLLYLSDDALMLLGDNSNNQSLNYVTKEYFENYKEAAPQEPVLPDGWKDDISQTVITSVKWVLSDSNPLDWCNLDGSRMNGWNNPSDYPDWLGTPDPAVYSGFSMTLDCKDNSAVFAYPDGSKVETSYELDDKGIYTFADAVPSTTVIGWASFGLDANNGLRIMSIDKDSFGNVEGIWLGQRSTEKDEYLAFHFTPQAGTAGEQPKAYAATLNWNNTGDWNGITGDIVSITGEGTYTASVNATWTVGDPLLWLDVNGILGDHPNADVEILNIKLDGSDLAFDDSAISRGYPDDNAETKSFRRYICNAWGLASCFPSLDMFKMQTSAEVTFKVTYDIGHPAF